MILREVLLDSQTLRFPRPVVKGLHGAREEEGSLVCLFSFRSQSIVCACEVRRVPVFVLCLRSVWFRFVGPKVHQLPKCTLPTCNPNVSQFHENPGGTRTSVLFLSGNVEKNPAFLKGGGC